MSHAGMSHAGWLPLPSKMAASGVGPPAVDESSATRLCLPASLLAEWTAASQRRQSAASSAQHSTAASARPHASHPIFMSAFVAGADGRPSDGRSKLLDKT